MELTDRTDLTDEETATAPEAETCRGGALLKRRQEPGLDCFFQIKTEPSSLGREQRLVLDLKFVGYYRVLITFHERHPL
jgi:hypothetical protein